MYKFIFLSVLFVTVTFMMAISNERFVYTNTGINDNSDSLTEAKQKYVDAILETIKGKENMQADSVFKDVQMLKGMPAEKMLGLMNKGFSTALGVGCDYCHNTQDYASNEIPAKNIAREMMEMSGQIREMLSKMTQIKNEKAHVNCATCHRGSIIPATKVN